MSRQLHGKLAEDIVLAYERLRIHSEADVKYVGDRHGIGFDIQSVESQNNRSPRYIEVKSVSESGHVFITERERLNLKALGDTAWIYAVDVREGKVMKKMRNPFGSADLSPSAITYKIKI